ncbi:MAG: GNAT family N-acetyltransferase [Promethearchaeota archaeon]
MACEFPLGQQPKPTKCMIYCWYANSDITSSFMGPPKFPDRPILTWEELYADYRRHYFEDAVPQVARCFIITADDTPVGQITYNDIDWDKSHTELDIWMSFEANCGKGYGPDALNALCDYLYKTHGVTQFIVQASERNQRAIRAYQKAGFKRLKLSRVEMETEYGDALDYVDSTLLTKRYP